MSIKDFSESYPQDLEQLQTKIKDLVKKEKELESERLSLIEKVRELEKTTSWAQETASRAEEKASRAEEKAFRAEKAASRADKRKIYLIERNKLAIETINGVADSSGFTGCMNERGMNNFEFAREADYRKLVEHVKCRITRESKTDDDKTDYSKINEAKAPGLSNDMQPNNENDIQLSTDLHVNDVREAIGHGMAMTPDNQRAEEEAFANQLPISSNTQPSSSKTSGLSKSTTYSSIDSVVWTCDVCSDTFDSQSAYKCHMDVANRLLEKIPLRHGQE